MRALIVLRLRGLFHDELVGEVFVHLTVDDLALADICGDVVRVLIAHRRAEDGAPGVAKDDDLIFLELLAQVIDQLLRVTLVQLYAEVLFLGLEVLVALAGSSLVPEDHGVVLRQLLLVVEDPVAVADAGAAVQEQKDRRLLVIGIDANVLFVTVQFHPFGVVDELAFLCHNLSPSQVRSCLEPLLISRKNFATFTIPQKDVW